ncbi:hypothetical protein H4R99_002630 [Coemansia sp. RSA 1722]|nr:hypothetical protein IWW45_002873 [Coemansia sp. RSA 485]KAJ2602630.1 hypothetical protein H4R99_002630 [Coemansia sp. RSA 1722]
MQGETAARTLDSDSRERVRRILREQIDLELYLKQKEVNTISERLRESEAQLAVIESAIQSQHHALNSAEDAADGYMAYMRQQLENSTRNLAAPSSTKDRPRRAAAAVRYMADSAGALYAQRASDDETVCMICPECQRKDFASLQAFLNHCRLQHSIEFSGPDEAIRICGVPIEEPEALSGRKRTNTQYQHQTKQHSGSSRVGTLASTLNSEQLSSVNAALDFIKTRVESSDSDDNDDSDAFEAHTEQPSAAPAQALPLPPPVQDSRFHVIRRVLLGNTSQFTDPQHRPAGKESSTHKWTVYMRPASADQPLSDYIRKMRVFLHPSYRPDDIVDLTPPNFELTRWGWGEFPIRVQVFFTDRRNKPVDLIHILKLDDTLSGGVVLGSETPIDFELDRRGLSAATGDAEPSGTNAAPANPLLLLVASALCRTLPLVLADTLPENHPVPESAEDILELVSPSIIERWKWGVAISPDVWHHTWPMGKQLAAEAARNRAIARLLASSVAEPLGRDGSIKERLTSALGVLLREAGASPNDTEAVLNLVGGSDEGICAECADMLQCWAAEHCQPKHLSPDRSRLSPENTAKRERSLRAWFRRNGFVPQLDRRVESTDRMRDGSGAAFYSADSADQGLANDESVSNPSLSDMTSMLGISGTFCATCGTLVVHKRSTTRPDSSSLYCCLECERVGKLDHTTVSRVAELLSRLPRGWDNPDESSDHDELLMVDDDTAAYANAESKAATCSAAEDIRLVAASLRRYHLTQQSERDVSNEGCDSDNGDNDIVDDGADTANIGNRKDDSLEMLAVRNQNAGEEQVDNEQGTDDEEENEKQSDHVDDNDDQAIDWVWSMIRPLELNCAPASRFSNSAAPNALVQNPAQPLVQLPNCSDEAFGEALDQRLVVGRLLLDVTKMFLRDLVSSSDQTMRENRAAITASEQKPPSSSIAEYSERIQAQLLMLNPLHILAAIKKDPESFDFCSNAYLAE